MAWTGTGQAHPSAVWTLSADDAGNDRFGIVFVNSAESTASEAWREHRYQRALDAGAGWTRWPMYWSSIESASGFDYSRQDVVVADDITHGLKVDAILLGTPDSYATGGLRGVPAPRVGQKERLPAQKVGTSLASSPPANLYEPVFDDGTDYPGPGKHINPRNFWARFVHKTVDRYRPGGMLAVQKGWPNGVGVRHWELWNEPDWELFWSGSIADYYRLLKVGYLSAKTADPEATVLIGGLAFFFNEGWLPALLDEMERDSDQDLRLANGSFFDAVPWHWYSNPRDLYDKTAWARRQLWAHGLGDTAIWVNETNVPLWDDYPGPTWDPRSPGRGTLEEQADFILQAYAYGLAAGVERVFIFQLYDDCGNSPGGTDFPPNSGNAADAFGLVRNPSNPADAGCFWSQPQPDIPRPAYTAYQVTASQLAYVTPLWRDSKGGIERLAFYRPPTERVIAVWNWRTYTQTVAIEATGPGGILIDTMGVTETVTPTQTVGATQTVAATQGVYTVTLPAVTNTNLFAAPGSPMIGGQPYLLVETDVITPTSRVAALPPLSPPTITVNWTGTDMGTGIANYDVWYSDGPPAPDNDRVPWFKDTMATSAVFHGEPGHTYYFASRARDRAGNREPFAAAPQAWTTVASEGTIVGTVTDVRSQPVISATVRVSHEGTETLTAMTDASGGYAVEGLEFGEDYAVGAEKEGYGSWSPRQRVQLAATMTTGVDLNLPPKVNLASNGGFEDGLDGWTLSGSTPVTVTGDARSGGLAALLGDRFVGQPELGGIGNSTLSQALSVPSGIISPTLSFSYQLETEETLQGNDWFEIILVVYNEPHYLLAETGQDDFWQPTDWTHVWFDINPYLSGMGSTAGMLVFNVRQSSAERPTRVYLDEVAVGTPLPMGSEGTIAGTVTDVRGQPVISATVSVSREGMETLTAVTDATGNYAVEGLEFGQDYEVGAEKEGYGSWSPRQRVQLVATTMTTGVDLNLPPKVNLANNGGFEDALDGWTLSGSTSVTVTGEARSGGLAALLGDRFVGQPDQGGIGNSTLSQALSVPSGIISPTLSFSYQLETEETQQGNDWFEIILVVDNEPHYLLAETGQDDFWQPTDWTHVWFDISPYLSGEGSAAGMLIFNVRQSSAERPTRVYLDEVVVGSAVPGRLGYRVYLPAVVKGSGH